MIVAIVAHKATLLVVIGPGTVETRSTEYAVAVLSRRFYSNTVVEWIDAGLHVALPNAL